MVTKPSKDDNCEHEKDRGSEGYDTIDEDSPIFNKDLNYDYSCKNIEMNLWLRNHSATFK